MTDERENEEKTERSAKFPIEQGADTNLAARLPKIVTFRELCRCGDEVWIENDGQLYRLRRTRQGKLILTK